MEDPIEAVAVDSGIILMVDPCYLFTEKQWKSICHKAHGGKVERPIGEVILEALELKDPGKEKTYAVIREARHGDGRYEVVQTDDGLLIRGT